MKKVVICDDDAGIRKGIRKLLEKAYEGAVVSEAENGLEGYRKILSEAPGVVVADVRMPMMSGLEMIEKAVKGGARFEAIVISAYSEFEYARTAIRYGVYDYLLKPINRFELLACFERIWGSHAGGAEMVSEDPEAADSVGRAVRFIQNNFFRNISLEDVGNAVGMNPNYLSSLLRKRSGMGYVEYLTSLRMKKAKNLLENTDLKVNSVAEMVGYNSTKYFTHIFKERYGVAPTTLREKGKIDKKDDKKRNLL